MRKKSELNIFLRIGIVISTISSLFNITNIVPHALTLTIGIVGIILMYYGILSDNKKEFSR